MNSFQRISKSHAHFDTISLQGLTDFEEVWRFQKECVEKRISNEIRDTFLFCEHRPVVTRGRGLQFTGVHRERHTDSRLSETLSSQKIPYYEIERGGDLTYHGPGQWVCYPICKLGNETGVFPKQDLHLYLRTLETSLVSLLKKNYAIDAVQKENSSGVWVSDKKIASLGVAVKKWVTYHGIALNVINDLSPFFLFSPCGFRPEVMTKVSDLTEIVPKTWRNLIESQFVDELNKV